ncbi:MAG: NUDIX hydrolase [Halobacteriales archaeon]
MVEVRALATDAVILKDRRVLLLERDHPPYEGAWVLPGGLVEPDETAREACRREANEEVGLTVEVETFVGLYDDPDRDERGNVSAAYRCRPIGGETPTANQEARRTEWFDPATLPEMGFDHETIVLDAVVEY